MNEYKTSFRNIFLSNCAGTIIQRFMRQNDVSNTTMQWMLIDTTSHLKSKPVPDLIRAAILPGLYTCTCLGGWEGVNCTDDVDECAEDPCRNDAQCSNTLGG